MIKSDIVFQPILTKVINKLFFILRVILKNGDFIERVRIKQTSPARINFGEPEIIKNVVHGFLSFDGLYYLF